LNPNPSLLMIESQHFPPHDWIPTLPSWWLNPNPSLLIIESYF
jgi:hypothetical protein